jgi:hypothetical protein
MAGAISTKNPMARMMMSSTNRMTQSSRSTLKTSTATRLGTCSNARIQVCGPEKAVMTIRLALARIESREHRRDVAQLESLLHQDATQESVEDARSGGLGRGRQTDEYRPHHEDGHQRGRDDWS